MRTVSASFVPERLPRYSLELLILLVLFTPWLWRRAQGALLGWVYTLHYKWGAFRAARLFIDVVRYLPVSAWTRSQLRRMKTYVHESLGETDAAVAGARELAAHAKADGCWSCANGAVNVFINAGLYLEALEFEKECRPTSDEQAQEQERLLVHFNLVEAVYNLGGWSAAGSRLEQLKDALRPHPLLWNFFPIQRAWILAHAGRGVEALVLLDEVEEQRVPRAYRSEFHYTRAAALLAVERYEDARHAVGKGIEVARRASSHRNGLFLRGRIALAAGHSEEALRLFEAGASHRYKGQGGDALLAWGDGLERLGRMDEAREVWRLVLERDKQSGAAREASSRLRSRPPPA